MEDYILELKNITKKFPGVVANNDINLNIKEGEIHAIIGENGAGKSTLMNILYGLIKPTSGKIIHKGKPVKFNNSLDARDCGIGMVHQHFKLVPSFTVWENITLGVEVRKNKIFVDEKKSLEYISDLSKKYGLEVNPMDRVEFLSVGIQQRVEILKALYKGADIIILDEPTAVLTPQETDELFVVIKELVKDQGKTVIIITHKLREVMAISDRVSVMRRGEMIDTVNTKDVDENRLAELMVGREVLLDEVARDKIDSSEVMMEVKDLYARNNLDMLAVRGMDLKLKKGEILGIAGIEGNGQSELIESLTGLRDIAKGEIYISGEKIKKINPLSMRKHGVAHVPEDRLSMGLSKDATIMENLLMGNQNKKEYRGKLNHLKKKNVRSMSKKLIADFDVRTPSEDVLIDNLSGGNMQKVVIAREFNFNTPILIISQPTRGVDIGAIEFIHQEIIKKRNEGVAILLVSAELDEIFRLSDRIVTMYEGRMTGEFKPSEITRQEIGLYMTGKTLREEE